MKNTHKQKHIITSTLILLILTITPHIQAAEKGFELPDGATARLGKGRIYSMQYTEDGTRLALATSMGVWLYDTIGFTEIYLLKKHKNRYAEYMAFSPDGKLLATADRIGTIHLWNTDTGNHKKGLRIQGGIVKIVFSRDGETFSILGARGSLQVRDTLTWEEKHNMSDILNYGEQGIYSLALSPDSFNIAAGDRNGLVSIYDPFSKSKKHELEGFEHIITEVALSSDDNFVVATNFRTIGWWDTNKEEIKHLIDRDLNVTALTFSPDDSLIASGSQVGDILLWDVNTGEQRQQMKGHTAKVIDIAFSSDLRTVASASVDGSVRIWDVFSGKELHVFDGYFGNFTCLDVSPDGKTVVAPTHDRTVCLWDVESAKLDTTYDKEGFFSVAEVAFNPTQNIIATASYGKFISLWDRDTDKLIKILKGHKDHVFSADFSPDGKTLVSGSKDMTVRLWDVDTLEEKQALEGHELAVTSVAFSPDGTTIASGGKDAIVRIWDANTGAKKHVLEGHELGVLSVAYSPDGTTLASVAETENIHMWNVATGKSNNLIVSDESALSSVVFHPNGKVIATGSRLGVVQLFDVNSGESLRKFESHLQRVTDLAFALDGAKLISRSDDGILYVWDVSSITQ